MCFRYATIIAYFPETNVTRMLRECYDFVTFIFEKMEGKSAFRPYGTGLSCTSSRQNPERRFLSKIVKAQKRGVKNRGQALVFFWTSLALLFPLAGSFRLTIASCPRVNACSESNRTKFNSDRLGSSASRHDLRTMRQAPRVIRGFSTALQNSTRAFRLLVGGKKNGPCPRSFFL